MDKIHSTRNTIHYDTSTTYDDVTVVFRIERNFFNYCVTLIIPCFIISCMIFLSFVLPPESGERIGLSMTVLLAMTVFQQLTSSIFPSFDFPLLGQYYLATSVEMSLSLIATAVIINFSYRKGTKMPGWMRLLFLEWLSRLVRLRETVKNSRPKPRKRNTIKIFKQLIDQVNSPKKEETSTTASSPRKRDSQSATSIYSLDQSNGDIERIAPQPRREDRLVENFKNLLSASNSSSLSQNREEYGIYNHAMELEDADSQETRECEDGPCEKTQTGILGENGELLSEEEVTMREWEWCVAARILDRLFMWIAVIVGITTLFAIFFRAKRLQQVFY